MVSVWFWQRKGKILAILFAVGTVLATYRVGYNYADTNWQLKWSQRDAQDAAALAQQQINMRIEEQRRQTTINKVIQDASQQIMVARRDTVSADATANKLHAEVNKLAKRLAERKRCDYPSTAKSSTAARHGTALLTKLFRLADEEAGRMAAIADQARVRGLACERAYDQLASE